MQPTKYLAAVLASVALFAGSCGSTGVQLDRFGGLMSVRSEATGRFRVDLIDGVWWFITPEGHGFYSVGVTGFDPHGSFSPALGTDPYHDNVIAKYGTEEAWAEVAQRRFFAWGYNSVGGWTDPTLFAERIPYMEVCAMSGGAPEVQGVPANLFSKPMRDYFDPAFARSADERADMDCRDCAENPFCIGVYTDNEIQFSKSLRQPMSYVSAYATLPSGAPGKLALQAFFEERYAGDVAAFNATWGTSLGSFGDLQEVSSLPDDVAADSPSRLEDRLAFVTRVSEQYHRVVHDALRAVSPELLILGSRFLGPELSRRALEAAVPYVDVISINDYDLTPGYRSVLSQNGRDRDFLFQDDYFSDLTTVHELTGKPIVITEWFYRLAREGAFPPGLPEVPDEATRADSYEQYIRTIVDLPFMLGTHWFQYQDQPEEGRGDGENQVIGLVDIHDDPHAIVERMAAVQPGLPARHARSADSP